MDVKCAVSILGVHGGQSKYQIPWTDVTCHAGAGNRTRVLCKGRKCS